MSSDHSLLLEIQKGESQTLEFKEQLPKGQQVAKTLIAFANTSGGKLVVGVSDDRQLVGIQDDIFELQDQITSMINEHVLLHYQDNCSPTRKFQPVSGF